MKRTKNVLLTGLLLAGPVFSGFSQLYFGLGTGYGFGLATVNLSDDIVESPTNATYTSNKSSFGQGLPIALNVGYKVKEFMSMELGFSYLLGGKDTYTYQYSGTGSSENTTNDVKANMLRIVPAFRFSFGEGKMQPYTRFGLSIGVMGKMIDTYHSVYTFGGPTTTVDRESEFTGGISLGLNSAMGFNYNLSEKMALFFEINSFAQSWAPKKGVYTKYTANGVDQLPFMTTYEKETEFVKEYSENPSVPVNQGAPDTSTQFHVPMSSVGLQVGITIFL